MVRRLRHPVLRLTVLTLFLALTACSTVHVNAEGTEKRVDWGLGIFF